MQVRFGNIRRTTLILIGLGLFLAGLVLGRIHLSHGEPFIISITVILMSIGILKFRQNKLLIMLSLLSIFWLGFLRGAYYSRKLDQYQELYGKNISITAIAKEDAVYSERRQLVFTAGGVKADDSKLVGNIQIEGYGVPMVYKGDVLEVTGKLFPKRGDNVAGMSFALIKVTKSGGTIIDTLRRNFAAGMQNVLPEPLASFGMGLLIGQRSTLPDNLIEVLTAVGLIHIIAVSGYNLTILVNISRTASKNRSRYQATIMSLVLIALFLLFTGGSPSIIRASVVSIIGLVGWYFGRDVKPMIVLLLSAAITAGFNPLYVWRSIGWYLSFTAFFGVLVLAPLIKKLIVKQSSQDKILPQILTETFAAQICTLPIILFVFGRLSLISIAANLLVIPFVPFAMLASLVAGIYGMVGPFLFGGVIVLPARIILEYTLSVSNVLAKVPYSNVELGIGAVGLTLMYIVIVVSTVILWLKTRKYSIIKA